ncbi:MULTISPECIES: arginase family protein [unclassified Carboxylicivirga]|uniref:arginase family protein n=1 Tax=Carboxylicivirga TaxID=1628153 RepID=UPI003D349D56
MTEDLIHYFDRPNYTLLSAFEGLDEERLVHQLICYQDQKVVDWSNVDVAVIGIADARNSLNKGCAQAPDAVRRHLYGLRALSKLLSIIDLGNIRGKTIDDRYAALQGVVTELLEKDIAIIVLGGSQDYTLPVAKAVRKAQKAYNLALVDSKIDWLAPDVDYSAASFLGYLCTNPESAPADLYAIGLQNYLCSASQESHLRKLAYETIRLGQIRQHGHRYVEPFMRDADVISVDMTVVRQCDQPARPTPMPNGLTGEELCQLLWYAGQSDRMKVFGVFELDKVLDINDQGVVLEAQAIWHILEGVALRYKDYPVKDLEQYRQFIVYLDDYELEIKFYNNIDNDRWWVEIPRGEGDKDVIACGRSDFETASANEIPEKWFRYFQKKHL